MEILIDLNNLLVQHITNLNKKGFAQTITYSFNTAELQEYTGKGTEANCQVWASIWKRFNSQNKPVVYWFEMDTDSKGAKMIFQKLCAYKGTARNVPAVKTNFNHWDTKTLYVGCCTKTSFVSRIFWHLGYYKNGDTQGLQLCHWAKEMDIRLTLHALFIPDELSILAPLYEKEIAKHLIPLLGKH